MFVFVFRLSIEKDKVDSYEIVYEKVDTVYHNIYYYDNEKLVYIEYSFNDIIEVDHLFDLLTNKSNSIKQDYDTKLIITTKLIDYEVVDNNLVLNVDEEFLRFEVESSYQILSQLRNTFSNLGYEYLFIKVNNESLDFIGNINISNGILLTNIV